MQYRKIADTDLELPVITFGAWAAGGWMWGRTERKEAVAAIRASYELGVTAVDTAPVYGQGTSEEIVGEALQNIPRSKVQILTKYGMRWDLDKPRGDFAFKSKNNEGTDLDIYRFAGRDSIINECESSLRRLRTDYIDLYQIHWPDTTTPIEESMEAVSRLIAQGKVRYAGVCNYNVAQMKEAEKHIHLVSNQVPYSMVKRDIEKEVVPHCISASKSILAYSPLERGLLTGKMTAGYSFMEGDHRANLHFFSDENIRRTNDFLRNIKPLADEKKVTLAQLVLCWTVNRPGITIALAGARNAEQAVANAKAAEVTLKPSEIEIINHHLTALQIVKPEPVR